MKRALWIIWRLIRWVTKLFWCPNIYKRLETTSNIQSGIQWEVLALLPVGVAYHWAKENTPQPSWFFGDGVFLFIVMLLAPDVARAMKGKEEWFTSTWFGWTCFFTGGGISIFFFSQSQLYGTAIQKASDREAPAIVHFFILLLLMQRAVPIVAGALFGRGIKAWQRVLIISSSIAYGVVLVWNVISNLF